MSRFIGCALAVALISGCTPTGSGRDGETGSDDPPVETDGAMPDPDDGVPPPDGGCAPGAEHCNGADDDCDGRVDEDAGCSACDLIECAEGEMCRAGVCISGDPPALDATPIAAPAERIELMGELDAASPLWQRPDTGCGAVVEGDHHYQVLPIRNDSGGLQQVTITADWPGVDGYLFVFSAPFEPGDPDGCLADSDDFISTAHSRVSSIAIQPGEALVIVATTYDAETMMPPFAISVLTLDTIFAGELLCRDGVDGDRDGLLNCADDDCALDALCGACTDVQCPPGQRCAVGGECVEDDFRQPIDIAAEGASIELVGALDDQSPTDLRVNESCDDMVVGDFAYANFLLINRADTVRTITVTADWGAVDGFLVIQNDTFSEPSWAWCLGANDDFGSPSASRIVGYEMQPGERIYVFATTYREEITMPRFAITVETQVSEWYGQGRCGDGVDQDRDGLIDCQDPGCRFDPACNPCDGSCGATGWCYEGVCNLGETYMMPETDAVIANVEDIIDASAMTWRRPTDDCLGWEDEVVPFVAHRIVNPTAQARYVEVRQWESFDIGRQQHAFTAGGFDLRDLGGCLDGRGYTSGLYLLDPGSAVVVITSVDPLERSDVSYRIPTFIAARGQARDGRGVESIALPGDRISIGGTESADDPVWPPEPEQNYDIHHVVNRTGAAQTIVAFGRNRSGTLLTGPALLVYLHRLPVDLSEGVRGDREAVIAPDEEVALVLPRLFQDDEDYILYVETQTADE